MCVGVGIERTNKYIFFEIWIQMRLIFQFNRFWLAIIGSNVVSANFNTIPFCCFHHFPWALPTNQHCLCDYVRRYRAVRMCCRNYYYSLDMSVDQPRCHASGEEEIRKTNFELASNDKTKNGIHAFTWWKSRLYSGLLVSMWSLSKFEFIAKSLSACHGGWYWVTSMHWPLYGEIGRTGECAVIFMPVGWSWPILKRSYFIEIEIHH